MSQFSDIASLPLVGDRTVGESVGMVSDLLAFLNNCRHLQTRDHFVTTLWAYVRSTPALRDAQYVKEIITTFEEKLSALVNYESAFSDFFYENAQVVLGTELGAHIWSLLQSISIFGMLSMLGFIGPKEVWKARIDSLGSVLKSSRTDHVENFLQKIVNFVKVLFERISECWSSGGDLSLLWGSTVTSAEWIRWCTNVLENDELQHEAGRPALQAMFKDKFSRGHYSSKITKQYMPEEMLDVYQELLTELEKIKLAHDGNRRLLDCFEIYSKRLREKIREHERFLFNGGFRVEPFALFIPGRSSIGKSAFLEVVHRALGRRLGLSTHVSSIHMIQAEQNFPNFNRYQWFAMGDDLDINPSPPSSSLNHAEIAMKYINRSPFNLEGAAIEDKGKLWANFAFVGWCTNHFHANLKGRLHDPIPFWRRFKYSVQLTPNPLYCRDGVLCSDRIPTGQEAVWSKIDLYQFDMTMFKVVEQTGKGSTPFDVYPYKLKKSYTNLQMFLRDFVDLVERYIQAENTRRDGKRCDLCGLTLESHTVPCDELPDNTDITYEALMEVTLLAFLGALLVVIWEQIREVASCAINACVRWQDLAMELGYYHSTAVYEIDKSVKRWKALLAKICVSVAAVFVAKIAFGRLYKKVSYQSTTEEELPVTNLPPSNSAFKRVPYVISRPYQKLAPTTWTAEQLKESYLACKVKLKLANGGTSWGFHLKKNVCIFPKHIFSAGMKQGREALIYATKAVVTHRGQSLEVHIDEKFMSTSSDRDYVLIYLPEVPFLNARMWAYLPPTSQASDLLQADEGIFLLDDFMDAGRPTAVRELSTMKFNNYMWKYSAKTESGFCGGILIAYFRNNFVVVGMHTASYNGSAFGEDLCHGELGAHIGNIEASTKIGGLVDYIHYESEDLRKGCVFKELPKKSSLWAYHSRDEHFPTYIGGTVDGFAATRFKSSVCDMPRRPRWDALELEVCGINQYYVPPSSKGTMIEDEWVDPFVVNLKAATNVGGEWCYWLRAVDDYLYGVTNLVARDRCRPISLYESIIGIVGTDMGGVDLNTSVGLPFSTPKKNHIRIDHEEKTVELSVELSDQIDRIEECILLGDAYSAPCNYVLKDEPISQSKAGEMKVRVFNVLPFAMNILMKKYFGPILCFMRTHPHFFETAIGMNVTSYQWDQIYNWLSVHPHWSAADNSNFDTHESTREALAVVSFFIRLAQLLNYTVEEIRAVRGLLMGAIYTTRVVKGDVFYTSFMMSTGFWLTIVINTVRNCLQRRYCFFFIRPEMELGDFRSGVYQLTLGDDNIFTTRYEWFTQVAIQAASREFGAVVTSANKSPVMKPFEREEDVTFLKRSFKRWNGLVLAPIDKKTIVKMLTVRTKSSLSMVDHVCTIYSNVLAESWMHGEDFFNIVSNGIKEIVKEEEFVSKYLVILPYSEYVTRYKLGVLSIWNPSENLEALV